MRRESVFARLLAATARIPPTGDLVKDAAESQRAGRPAAQLLAAIGRATPAFNPAGVKGGRAAPDASSPGRPRPRQEPVPPGSVGLAMIEEVQRRIYHALVWTSAKSTLPEDEQDRLLAMACAEACAILGEWADSSDWQILAPSGPSAKKPIADAVADWTHVKPFLDTLTETVSRISERRHKDHTSETTDPAQYVEKIISSVEATSRGHSRLDRQELYREATARIHALKDQACTLSSELRTHAGDNKKRKYRRSRARQILGTVDTLSLSVSLAVASAVLSEARRDIPERGIDAMQVLVVHHIAETAAPALGVGQQLRPRTR